VECSSFLSLMNMLTLGLLSEGQADYVAAINPNERLNEQK
jgi:hypothetical protein